MATATTEVKEEKLSFMMDDEEFLTRLGAMREMKIGATTLAKEIRLGNITPYNLPHGYAFSKASVREWMNNRKKKFLQKLKAKR
jgi:hypothetical protein